MGFENGKLVRVTLRATLGARQEVNTLHYDLDDGTLGPANDPQTLADRIRDDVRGLWAALYRPAWTVQPVEVVMEKDPLNPTAPRSAWSSGAAIAGTNGSTGDQEPSAICMVAKLGTAHIGRRFNGRIFLGGSISDAYLIGNSFVSGLITVYTAVLDAIPREPDIAGGESDATAKWCVYSRTQRAANLDPYASPVTYTTVRTQAHWLRRRAGI